MLGRARTALPTIARAAVHLALGAFALVLTGGLSGATAEAASPAAHAKKVKKKAPAPKRKTPRDKAKRKSAVAQVSRSAPVPPPLDGNTYDFDYDGKDVGHPERAYAGRSFIHTRAAGAPRKPLPVLVFLHGLNKEAIPYRWMGGGREGDVRRIVSDLIETNEIPPMLVAAPSTIDPATATNALLLWPAFDLDVFLDQTAARLDGLATIDRTRVIVAGHSGGGCNVRGGISTALSSKTRALAGLVIDTCMLVDEATHMAHVRQSTHVVVSWQSLSWADRYFEDFRNTFTREVKRAPPAPGILRELVFEQPTVPSPHDAMVSIVLRKWLPHFLPGASTKAAPVANARAGSER